MGPVRMWQMFSFHGMDGMWLLAHTVATHMVAYDAVIFLEKHPLHVVELMLGS